MPTTATEYTQTAQEQTLKAVRQGQQAIVEAVKAWAAAIEKASPEAPALPYPDEFPTPKEFVSTSFNFANQLLEAQREFAESIVDAAASGQSRPAPKAKASAS